MTSITVYGTRMQGPPGKPDELKKEEFAILTLKTDGKTLDFIIGEGFEIPPVPLTSGIRIQVSSD